MKDNGNPFEQLLRSGGDPDDEALADLLYPSSPWPTAREREETARAEQEERRKKFEAEAQREQEGGIYRAPFPQEDGEGRTAYGYRLYQALSERDMTRLAECVVDKRQFRVGKSKTAPLFCGDYCYSKAIKADKKENRKRKR
jgi:hypothetical protein